MKKILFAVTIATLTLGSCRENKTETKEIIREVQVETPAPTSETEDKEGILERTAKEIDKEVNEEIDKTIEKIGNDN